MHKLKSSSSHVVVFSSDDDDDDDEDYHGIQQANTVREVAQWRRLDALHEANDAHHQAM
jgi:hypothetical protein